MFTCSECGQDFERDSALESHFAFHRVLKTKNPDVYLIQLPDGCTPGRWEAVEAFSEAFAELEERIGSRPYQFAEFSSQNFGGEIAVTSYLVKLAPESSCQARSSETALEETTATPDTLPSLEQLLRTSDSRIARTRLRRYLATMADAEITSARDLLESVVERLLQLEIPLQAWERVEKRLRSAGHPHDGLEHVLKERRQTR